MRRLPTRLCAVLICVATFGLVTGSPAAAAQGVTVQITELRDPLAAGSTTITVVASKGSGGDCLKVRWSLVLRAQGVQLSQVRVGRFEDTGLFPVDIRSDGDAARLTDVAPDPGTLCRDRTVTARYQLVLADNVTAGRMQITAEAYNVNLQLLERASATRAVFGEVSSAQPNPEPGTEAVPADTPTDAAVPGPTASLGAGARRQPAASSAMGLLPVGLAIGGVMIFLGFSLLLKVLRRRPKPAETATDRLVGDLGGTTYDFGGSDFGDRGGGDRGGGNDFGNADFAGDDYGRYDFDRAESRNNYGLHDHGPHDYGDFDRPSFDGGPDDPDRKAPALRGGWRNPVGRRRRGNRIRLR